MAEYQAPLEDMNFVLTELVDFEGLMALPGHEELNGELTESILEEANKLARDVLSPINWSGDIQGLTLTDEAEVITPDGFKEAYKQYSEGGWGSLQFDPEYGGQGLPFSLAVAVQEMWHASNMSWGLCPMLTQGAIEAIEANASDELKAKFLPQLISGEWNGTMNLTEPQSGSDMATIKTRAEREGDHYRIFGQKIFITWGENDMSNNVIHLVLARLPDGPPGVKGLSLFIVPKYLVNDDGSLGERNDVKCLSIEHKIGIHASPTCVMGYGDNDGAIGYLVGEEHRGLACMFSMMNNARLTVGLQGTSIGSRAFQQARNFAHERSQGVAPGESEIGPIIKHPDVRRMLLTMRALNEATRAVTYVACSSVDFRDKHPEEQTRQFHSARASLLTPIVKGWATEIGPEVASLGVQVHGGMGFIEETGAAQHYRDSRILPIYEGTNGIQAADLAGRKTLGDGGRAMDELLGDMRTAAAEARQQEGVMAEMASDLSKSIDALEQIKDKLIAEADQDINLLGSISYNYLMTMGYVCGGWQLLRAAIASKKHLLAGSANAEFYENKINMARFYMTSILSRHMGYYHAAMRGSDATTSIDVNAI